MKYNPCLKLFFKQPAPPLQDSIKFSGHKIKANEYIFQPKKIILIMIFIVLFYTFIDCSSASVINTKLSDFQGIVGDVSSYLISPDNSRVVYRADQDTEEVFELYSVPIGGGAVTKLNDTLVLGGDVQISDIKISPDSSRVVYLADQDTDGVYELYSVPIGGGTVTKLNDSLVSGGDVQSLDIFISPDSSRLVYRADQDTDDVYELYSVPIGGGTVTKLNDALVFGDEVSTTFFISPDCSRVVYLVDQVNNGTIALGELYSVPIGGGTVIKLNDSLVSGGFVYFFRISSDSSRVVYRADQDTVGVFELYSVPIDGGTVIKLNDSLVSGGDVHNYGFLISSDSSRVVYMADQDTDEVYELYSVPIDGGTVTKLNDSLVPGGRVGHYLYGYRFLISPDSSRVVYRAEQDTDNTYELIPEK
ncbi:MAG: hypothetical protein JW896_11510, partial [Deltaproteobacteria bacterium]|nr:hypothetical protein [Deltaproteobacteria bacterium]